MAPLPDAPWRHGLGDGLRYGALGLPLAFVALPLYVLLPNHYASTFGVPLATLGALLLAARLLDAALDPLIGRAVDRRLDRRLDRRAFGAGTRLPGLALAAAVLLALGFHGLFFPPVEQGTGLIAWAAVLLVLTYLGYSVLSVLHQAWGARLGGDEAQRARIVSWREGLALVGVVVASVLPALAGLGATTAVFAAALAIGLVLLARAPRPVPPPPAPPLPWQAPLRTPAFRRLLSVYVVNGIASAVPATLVLFFVRDRLQLPTWEPAFLASYFAAGALSMPLWVRAVARWGLARAWLVGMGLAMAAFVWAATLGTGDGLRFLAVCMATGVALGADLALPGALLAGVVQAAGHGGRLEGAYFGWWNFATKLNLALAAGIALPLLATFGYAPGSRDEPALAALTLAYCALPCALKALAAGLLWWQWIRHPEPRPVPAAEELKP